MNQKRIVHLNMPECSKKQCIRIGLVEGGFYTSLFSTPCRDYWIILIEKKIFAVPSWIMQNVVSEL